MLFIFALILALSLLFNLILSCFLLFLQRPKRLIKVLAEKEFFKAQLESVAADKGRKRYRADRRQKLVMSLLYKFLGCPKELYYVFKPATILNWYRNLVKRCWTYFTNRGNVGRPAITNKVVALIIRLKRENPSWGARRISGELRKLSIKVSKSKVAEILNLYGLNPDDEPTLTWSRFLKENMGSLIGCDFKTVTTLFGIRLYIIFFISHSSKEILHFNITTNPTRRWLEQQLRNLRLILDHDDKIFIIRDNDILYRPLDFKQFNFCDVPIAPFTPNMNAVTERFIGSFKREALNDFIIINERQLRYITGEYVRYYNNYRPHQGLGNITIPQHKSGETAVVTSTVPTGRVKCRQFLYGKLKHYYYDNAA